MYISLLKYHLFYYLHICLAYGSGCIRLPAYLPSYFVGDHKNGCKTVVGKHIPAKISSHFGIEMLVPILFLAALLAVVKFPRYVWD